MNKTKTMFLLGALLTANLLVWVQSSMAKRESVIGQLDLLVDLRQQIVHGYVEKPDEDKMIQAAARAMVASLEDPYTVYFSPEEREQFDKQVRGSFSGIGAEIDLHESRPRIVSPLEESPAWKAGVLAGDIILEIDGESSLDLKLTDVIGKLTGQEGTDVKIKVRHLSGEEADITITRARINVHTVKGIRRNADQTWDYMLDPVRKIGYIRLTQFNDRSADEMKEALESLVKQDVKGLVLDLRFNPGGLLDAAVSISDMFLPQGKRIVSTKGRTVPEEVRMSSEKSIMLTQPLVVLINEGSASAAEIVSGALLDNDRAQIVGTRSYGKGSVQQVRALGMEAGSLNPNNRESAIKLTNAYYYLPNGRNIHRRPNKDTWGVDPRDGFYVSMNTEAVREMIKVRREGDILHQNDKDTDKKQTLDITADWIDKNLADAQLAAGFKTLAGKLETDNWPVVGMSDVQSHELAAKLETLENQRQFLQNKLSEIKEEIDKLDKPLTIPTGAPEVKGAMTTSDDKVKDKTQKVEPQANDKAGDKTDASEE